MPKGGSGFRNAAWNGAVKAGKGASRDWRLSDPTKYAKDIQKAFQSMYRSGIVIQRDERGRVIGWKGTDEAIMKAGERLLNLAQRMSNDLELYNPEQAREYSILRQKYGNAISVSSKDWKEFLNTKRARDTVLINPRGRRGIASGADARAEEVGGEGGNVVNTLHSMNEALNDQRRMIWRKPMDGGERNEYVGNINETLIKQYERAEKAAWKRRKT